MNLNRVNIDEKVNPIEYLKFNKNMDFDLKQNDKFKFNKTTKNLKVAFIKIYFSWLSTQERGKHRYILPLSSFSKLQKKKGTFNFVRPEKIQNYLLLNWMQNDEILKKYRK